MLEKFYETLFDPGQFTCFGETHKATGVARVHAQNRKPFFTINALHARRDLKPTEPYHARNRPRRADHNVICLRNFLLEMDCGSTGEQMEAIERSGIPWSTCVSSGGKSLHFVVSLSEPLGDLVTYTRFARGLYAGLISANVKIDAANKNPSRFSRAPGVIRPETGLPQELIAVRGRIENQTLVEWLGQSAPPVAPAPPRGQLLAFPKPVRIFASTQRFLEAGAPEGEWNISLFRAACNLFAIGYSLDQAETRFRSITGRLDPSDLSTIRSAFRRVAGAGS